MSDSADARRARAFLQHAAEPTTPVIAHYIADIGPVDAAHHVAERTAPTEILNKCRPHVSWRSVDTSLQTAADLGGRFVIPEDDEWPADVFAGLSTLDADSGALGGPPLGLWVQGDVRLDELAAAPSIAIGGSRAATAYGEHYAADLAYELAARGVPVVSGAAYGIDGAAHRGALSADGVTVAVLGCAIDVGYPAGHISLLNRIVSNRGALVSEYPPGTPPARHRFLVRNRLIAALTTTTLIVEAGRRSGAHHTARLAGKLGRPVLALPGPVSSSTSAGCHQLIQDSTARLITSTNDVLAVIKDGDDAGTEPETAHPADEAGRR
ncbi:DNA-processing protein DprA [Amycolatopsis sp. Hca4]|uniref:DNA-processing protein DprA n=1 Tax=Amycolatopsis sp. Hca4 TaxID=2742131 RepID=UPI00158FE19C|nr:DNA-processing protein DprA [Amycolatopsis sp. Hca4]QKV74186.1 DNA-protecting protein DprA [Amycolatopsis sp. Hca4]